VDFNKVFAAQGNKEEPQPRVVVRYGEGVANLGAAGDQSVDTSGWQAGFAQLRVARSEAIVSVFSQSSSLTHEGIAE